MRYRSFTIAFGLAAGALLFPGLRAADVAVIDEIICKVNGDIITRGEIEKGRKQMEATMRQQGLTGVRLQDALKTNEKALLRDRIDGLLLVNKAKELNVNVDSDINKQIADIQRETKIADPEKFQEFVKQETGRSFEDYKSELKNQALTNRVVRQEIASKIQFKREDQLKYYEEHKNEFQRDERVFLREILVAADPANPAAAETKAKDISARAKKGEKFEDMAAINSDSQSAQQGGDIGSFVKGNLRQDLEAMIWDQPKGFVTNPINVGNGFLVLKVDDHQKAGLAGFEEAQPEITSKLFQPRFQPELRKYLTTLREQAFLEIKPGWEDIAAAPGKDTRWVDPAEIKAETTTKEDILGQTRRKRLLGVVPIPGTSTANTGTSSSR